MSFLKVTDSGENNVFKYLLTLIVVIFSFQFIGNIPLLYILRSKGLDLEEGISAERMSEVLDQNSFFILILMPFIVGLITLLICVRTIHGKNPLTIFTSRKSIDWKRFFFSFFLYGIILTIFLMISIYTNNSIVWNFNSSTFFMLLLVSFFLLPLQTTFEEVFLRGYLMQGAYSVFRKGWLSVLIISLLFASLHLGNPEVQEIGYVLMIYYVVNGIFLGLIVLMDDGLELSMGYHAVNNIFASLIVTNNWQSFQTDALYIDKGTPSFGIENILTLVVVQPLLIFIFSKKYKWTNWKEKIIGKKS